MYDFLMSDILFDQAFDSLLIGCCVTHLCVLNFAQLSFEPQRH